MKYSSNTINTPSNKKKYILIALAALLLVAAVAFYLARSRDNTNDELATATEAEYEEKIDLSPPTEEEKQAVEDNKQRLIEESNQQTDPTPPASDSGKQKAVPVIGFLQQGSSGNIEANGYIAEAIESDGTCTLTLEKDGATASQSKQAMPDAQSTICGLISIERSQLSPGEWKATLSYSSAKYQGESEPRIIQVN